MCSSRHFLLCAIFVVTIHEAIEWSSQEAVWGKDFFAIDFDASKLSASNSRAKRMISAHLWNSLAWDPLTVKCQVYHSGSLIDDIPEFTVDPGSEHHVIFIQDADLISCLVSWRTKLQPININNDDRELSSQWKFDEDGLYKNVSSEFVFYQPWRW